ncbi:unnamed protein product [Mytilus coruscus]|uniref:Mab-21-like HhH/H2TH-like domain-containing protein n=1 Tax=Mytilus coruscus TaxID=42192 RepID=A0A6J8AWW1_MYTCO|nr:unnamed protein product [Mytilus coruscus]
MEISNDVFGLTISQFERMYKACLERRITKEQWILNLRYPDKSSKEYLEYLENCTDYKKDHLLFIESDPKKKYLYRLLVNTIGTEIDIRMRQRLFIIHDMIVNACVSDTTKISSGSLAEGLNLPGSDRDIMYVNHRYDVIRSLNNIKYPIHRTTFVMETDIDHPGFTKLRLKAGGVNVHCQRHPGTCTSKWWIRNYGCLLVPIGPKTLPDNALLWRLSFSVAEKILIFSFNFTQLLCYGLLKLMLKRIVNTQNDVKDLLCSYFLKTALFWVSEEIDIDTFQLSKIYFCFCICLDKIISWLKTCYCPNYFIPAHNMFLGKINQRNNKLLLCVLESIKSGGIDGLINNLFAPVKGNHLLSSTDKESSFIMLDLLHYSTFCDLDSLSKLPRGNSSYIKGLGIADFLLKSETSTFIIDSCKYHIARISQKIAQKLPPPHTEGETNNIRKCYHKLLQYGIKTDAVSGWLLYASYLYVTRQFNATIKLTEYVLSRYSPDMILKGIVIRKNERIFNSYKSNVHSTMTLNEKMTIFTVDNIEYLLNSSLIPDELQLEVKNHTISIPPVFMSHCLRFLCYHHLGDIPNRQEALRVLHVAEDTGRFTSEASLAASLTILGVCNEISGYKDAAYQFYVKSLEVMKCKCSTAEIRKRKLFDI